MQNYICKSRKALAGTVCISLYLTTTAISPLLMAGDTGKTEAGAPPPMPRVMLMVDEQSLGTIATAEVEALAYRKLMALKVPVLDRDMVRANIARNQEMLRMADDARGAAVLGAHFGADVVLVGEAVAKPSARRIGDTNLRSYQAVVTLRAVRTDNAAVIAADSKDATQIGIEDAAGSAAALRAAAESVLDDILPQMLAGWAQSTDASETGGFGHQIELVVGGVDQVWKLREIRQTLRGREKDLANVIQRGYAAGVAEFSISSALPPEELAETIVLEPPEGLQIQVLGIEAGRIQLRAVERTR